MLATDMIPCEDGHAQERSLSPEILGLVAPNDLWIADRNFCTMTLLSGIAKREAFYIIRQHANMSIVSAGTLRRRSRTDRWQSSRTCRQQQRAQWWWRNYTERDGHWRPCSNRSRRCFRVRLPRSAILAPRYSGSLSPLPHRTRCPRCRPLSGHSSEPKRSRTKFPTTISRTKYARQRSSTRRSLWVQQDRFIVVFSFPPSRHCAPRSGPPWA